VGWERANYIEMHKIRLWLDLKHAEGYVLIALILFSKTALLMKIVLP